MTSDNNHLYVVSSPKCKYFIPDSGDCTSAGYARSLAKAKIFRYHHEAFRWLEGRKGWRIRQLGYWRAGEVRYI